MAFVSICNTRSWLLCWLPGMGLPFDFCSLAQPSDSSSAGCQVCAYHLDFWLSTSNASKVYLLMGIVCLLALVGGVSLYAVSSGVCLVWDQYQTLGSA